MAKNKKRMSILKKLNEKKDEGGLVYKTELSGIFKELGLGYSDGEKLIGELSDLEYISLLGGYKGKNGKGYRTIKITGKGIGEIENILISKNWQDSVILYVFTGIVIAVISGLILYSLISFLGY